MIKAKSFKFTDTDQESVRKIMAQYGLNTEISALRLAMERLLNMSIYSASKSISPVIIPPPLTDNILRDIKSPPGDVLASSSSSELNSAPREEEIPEKAGFVGNDGQVYEDEFPTDEISRSERIALAEENAAAIINPATKMNPAMEEALKKIPPKATPMNEEHAAPGILENSTEGVWDGRDVEYDY